MKLVPAHFLPMTATMTSHLLSILHNPPGNKNGLGDESDDQIHGEMVEIHGNPMEIQ